MKRHFLAVTVLLVLSFSTMAQEQPAAEGQEQILKTDKDRVSYGIGVDAAQGFIKRGFDLDPEILTRGFKDVFAGKDLLMTEEEIRTILTAHQKAMSQGKKDRKKELAEKNKVEGEAFLEENRYNDGVVTLSSGLQYKVIKIGEGRLPKEEDVIEAHYRGTFIDGKEFDSSARRGQPAIFSLKRVIAGWKEALQLMPEGSKWQLFIPSKLAYGKDGNDVIGPNAVLIYEVELLSIKPAEEAEN